MECCLQERVFNKYYTILASKLCEHDKNHKFTLQVKLSQMTSSYCITIFGYFSYLLFGVFPVLPLGPL